MKGSNYSAEEIYGLLTYTLHLISMSRYGPYFVVKGGTALMDKVLDKNMGQLFRKTQDIDLHLSNKAIWISFLADVSTILNSNQHGIKYEVTKVRSIDKLKGNLDKSDSIDLLVTPPNRDSIKIKIDMNIKSDDIIGIELSNRLNMKTYDLLTMLTDKLVVASSPRIFRRVKDMYDIVVISCISDFYIDSIYKMLKLKHGHEYLSGCYITSEYSDMLSHAYSKYDGILCNVLAEQLRSMAHAFYTPIYLKEHNLLWKSSMQKWVSLT